MTANPVQLGEPLAGADISIVRQTLMHVFPNHERFTPLVSCSGYLQLNKTTFLQHHTYRKWLDHEQSSLFFVSGSTAYEGRNFSGCTHCWLSPAAIYIAESLRDQQQKVAFFSCHPGLERQHIKSETVLSCLVSQLLRWRPSMLRTKEAIFRNILENKHNHSHEHVHVDLLHAVLLELAGLETIYLVLDRPDMCVGTRIDKLVNELARLITLLKSTDFRVKIAVVAETSGGAGNWRSDFLPGHAYATERLFVETHWDQRRLTSSETSAGRRPSIWSSSTAQTV
jgi:hypothetical protein